MVLICPSVSQKLNMLSTKLTTHVTVTLEVLINIKPVKNILLLRLMLNRLKEPTTLVKFLPQLFSLKPRFPEEKKLFSPLLPR